MPLDLPAAARIAAAAADRARAETMPRFRKIGFEEKADGSPVTEADRAAEQAIRAVLREATPDWAVLGEEYGAEGDAGGPRWLVDPIDGTIAYSRGIPLYTTLIALLEDERPVLGLIDVPMLDERYEGHRGGGCTRNGSPVRVSDESDPRRAIISHGDVFSFERFGYPEAYVRMAAALPFLRGYTDAFGHTLVLSGGVGAMVDLHLNPWDAAATEVLIPEAGGVVERVPDRAGDTIGLAFGSGPLVEHLLGYLT